MFSLKRQQGASFEHQARLFLESKGLKFIARLCPFRHRKSRAKYDF